MISTSHSRHLSLFVEGAGAGAGAGENWPHARNKSTGAEPSAATLELPRRGRTLTLGARLARLEREAADARDAVPAGPSARGSVLFKPSRGGRRSRGGEARRGQLRPQLAVIVEAAGTPLGERSPPRSRSSSVLLPGGGLKSPRSAVTERFGSLGWEMFTRLADGEGGGEPHVFRHLSPSEPVHANFLCDLFNKAAREALRSSGRGARTAGLARLLAALPSPERLAMASRGGEAEAAAVALACMLLAPGSEDDEAAAAAAQFRLYAFMSDRRAERCGRLLRGVVFGARAEVGARLRAPRLAELDRMLAGVPTHARRVDALRFLRQRHAGGDANTPAPTPATSPTGAEGF